MGVKARIAKAVAGLDMTQLARMKRAADQGFDTPMSHGTTADIDAFDVSDLGVHVGSQDAADVRLTDKEAGRQGVSNYRTRGRDYGEGANVLPLQVRAKNSLRMEDVGEWRDPSEVLSGLSQSHLPAGARHKADVLAREAWDIRDQFEDMEDWYTSMEADDFMEEARALIKENGFDSVVYNNFIESKGVSSDSMILLDPANIRSTNAAFDPANIGKNDLLGNVDPRMLAPLALAGGAGMLASNDAEAAPMGTLADKIRLATRKAFHGSPHDFPPHETNPLGKFDLGKMGTGEGAQAYGHGLYFSSSEDIARFYRDQLSGTRDKYGRLDLSQRKTMVGGQDASELGQDVWEIADQLASRNIGIDDYLSELAAKRDATNIPSRAAVFDELIEQAERVAPELRGQDVHFQNPGHLYQVEIPDESHMLDWDKPLSEQPESVKEALRPLLKPREVKKITHERGPVPVAERHGGMVHPEQHLISAEDQNGMMLSAFGDTREEAWAKLTEPQDLTGMQIHNQLSLDLTGGSRRGLMEGGEVIVSEKLRKLGIPGITYKGATSDERNFVVFDDELINIVNKGFVDPKLLTGLGGAAAGYAALSGDEPNIDLGRLGNAVASWRKSREGKPYGRMISGLDLGADLISGMVGPTMAGLDQLAGAKFRGQPITDRGIDEAEERYNYSPFTEKATRWGEDAWDWVGEELIGPIMQQQAPQTLLNQTLPYWSPEIEKAGEMYREIPENIRAPLRAGFYASDFLL